jgi:hypothetical protein
MFKLQRSFHSIPPHCMSAAAAADLHNQQHQPGAAAAAHVCTQLTTGTSLVAAECKACSDIDCCKTTPHDQCAPQAAAQHYWHCNQDKPASAAQQLYHNWQQLA